MAANHTSSMDGRKCNATDHQANCSHTEMPPMTACATIPNPWMRACMMISRRRCAARTATYTATTNATSTNVSSRLPNSIAWCTAGAAPCTGTSDPS